jgi:hypothetical protein
MMIDEISLLLGKRIVTKVSTPQADHRHPQETEQSQRVLKRLPEGFR